MCESHEFPATALWFAYDKIKPTDIVAVGVWQKYADQVGENTRLVRELLDGR